MWGNGRATDLDSDAVTAHAVTDLNGRRMRSRSRTTALTGIQPSLPCFSAIAWLVMC
jgi:hypothetical protein